MKELKILEDGLDSADFFLNVNVTQTEEDKFFEELLSLKQKIHTAIQKQDEIEHVKDLMKMICMVYMINTNWLHFVNLQF